MFNYTITSSGQATNAFMSIIEDQLAAAIEYWGEFINGHFNSCIDFHLIFDNQVSSSSGRALTSIFVGRRNGVDVFEENVVHELRTGNDINGGAFDAEIVISLNEFFGLTALPRWIDPTPFNRSDDYIPSGYVDLLSNLVHEVGHALGFNAFTSGGRPAPTGGDGVQDVTTYEELIDFTAAGGPRFTGQNTVALLGQTLDITNTGTQAIAHYGEAGTFLVAGLMNGVEFRPGERYEIGGLDVAILSDLGLNTTNFHSFLTVNQFDRNSVVSPINISNAISINSLFNTNGATLIIDSNENVTDVQNSSGYYFSANTFDALESATGSTGATPVYRFFNTSTGGFFFTINTEEANVVRGISAFRDDGIAFFAFNRAGDNLTPVYRFYDLNANVHRFTGSEEERLEWLSDDSLNLNDEGIAWWALDADFV